MTHTQITQSFSSFLHEEDIAQVQLKLSGQEICFIRVLLESNVQTVKGTITFLAVISTVMKVVILYLFIITDVLNRKCDF